MIYNFGTKAHIFNDALRIIGTLIIKLAAVKLSAVKLIT